MIFNWFGMRDKIISGEYINEANYTVRELDSKIYIDVGFIEIDGKRFTWSEYFKNVKIRCSTCGGLKDSYDFMCDKCTALYHKRWYPNPIIKQEGALK